jgi:nicotinate-nucleotide pyrophosphorylase (carboxylating)
LIELALEEDLGNTGDLTSQAVIPAESIGQAAFVARVGGVTAGLQAAELVCKAVDGRIAFHPLKPDGSALRPGDRMATLSGPMRGILGAERTAVNFLQRLSGIASRTRRYVDAVAGLPCKILDTRKTTPGWRLLDKFAVRCGGGHNHRIGLFDGILIKDNHLAALGTSTKAISQAVQTARQLSGSALPIEVEVDSLVQFDEAIGCGPDAILLDNMSLDDLREAVRRRNRLTSPVKLEASGGIRLTTVREVADTGVDWISVGDLTHSVSALDIGLDYFAKSEILGP